MKVFNTMKSIAAFPKKYKDIKKQLKIAMDGLIRPTSGDPFYSSGSAHIYPLFPYGGHQLYDFARNSDTLSIIHAALRREMFRNGTDLIEAKNTDETITTSEEEVDVAEEETDEDLEEQKIDKERKKILEKLENINENRQSIIDIGEELEDDMSIMDDSYLLFILTYNIGSNGKIVGKDFSQAIRADPRYMGLVQNKYDRPGYDDENNELFFCPLHRNQLLSNEKVCPKCNTECLRAFFFSDYGNQNERVYYSSEEVVHKSKYRPSKRLGYSPIYPVWQKVRTLLFMDKYIMELYDGQRPPKAGLFFKTSNLAALDKSWKAAVQRATETPHMPTVMGVPDSSNGQGFVEFIDFMKSLDELQHTVMRNEYRNQIGAVYGVEPIYQNDTSTSGGLNNEGLQITVTNRAVEKGQAIYNNYFFPRLLEVMGVEGWHLRLNPSEEQDEMAKLERQKLSLENGQMAVALGLQAEYDDDSGEVVVKPGTLEKASLPEGGFSPFDSQNPPFEGSSGTPEMPSLFSKEESLKILKKKKDRVPFSKLSDTIKKEVDKFFKKFKRKPSEEELREAITKLNFSLQGDLKNATDKLFKETYLKEADKVGKELGINVLFDVSDKNALKVLATQDVLSKAYVGLTTKLVGELNEVIVEGFRDPTLMTPEKLKEKIKEIADVSDFQAENIARTETSKVSVAARKNSYSKERDFEVFKFKHIGPNDNRTTSTSKRIKDRTKLGVTWENYVKIIEEESIKDFPQWTVNKDFPVSHYQSRHVFVRVQ